MKMKLTVIDTPGFGDQINNDNWWVLERALNTDTVGAISTGEARDLNIGLNVFAVNCLSLSETAGSPSSNTSMSSMRSS